MNCDNSEEIFPVVDAAGTVVGSATRGECHGGSTLLHPVVHLHVFNSKGELYLQKRPAWKDIQPGRWDTAVGGMSTMARRLPKPCGARSARSWASRSSRPRRSPSTSSARSASANLVHVYRAVCDGPVRPSGELDGGRFWSVSGDSRKSGKGIFTPNFEGEIGLILD